MGTYTNKWSLYLPDVDEEDWGDAINANFITIAGHLGGRLTELADFAYDGSLLDGDIIRYDVTTEKWTNCPVTGFGIQDHGDLNNLDEDSHLIYLLLDGTLPMAGDINLNYHKISNSLDPQNPGDLVTKRYFDSASLPYTSDEYVITIGVNDPASILMLTVGDAYIIGDTPVGLWSGHSNKLTIWDGTNWIMYTPLREGKVVYALDEHQYYRYDGTAWTLHFKSVSHSDLDDLAVDDHPQYLNSARHNQTSAHTLGSVVPFGELMTLEDVSIDISDLTHGKVLQYIIPEFTSIGAWSVVSPTTVGHQTHNALGGRGDVNGSDISICDPDLPEYNLNEKCHPQYISFKEHDHDTHASLIDLYVPYSNLPFISIDSPASIRSGGHYEIYRPSVDLGELIISAEGQTKKNTINFPDSSGSAMVLIDTVPSTNGHIVVTTGSNTYKALDAGVNNCVLISRGEGETPAWVPYNDESINTQVDWAAESGAGSILNKPREFVFVTDTEPVQPQAGDIWVDTSS